MEKVERDGFVFYNSFYDAIKSLDDPNIKWKIVEAICEYGLNGNEIELDAISRMAFNLVKPQLDANNKRYINGKKGGNPNLIKGQPNPYYNKDKDNQKITKTLPKDNQEITKTLPKDKEKDKVKEKDKEKDKDIYNKVNNTIPFISLPLIDKTNYDVSVDEVNEYQSLYLDVDVEQEFRNMKGWLKDNPTKRKTRKCVHRFINGWLTKSQNNQKYYTVQSSLPMDAIKPDKVCEENDELTEEEIMEMMGGI